MGKPVIIGLLMMAIVGLGFFLVKMNDETRSSSSAAPAEQTSPTATPKTSNSQPNQKKTANTITYTDSGFSPSTLTVKSGTVVTIINNSSWTLQFDSDPHPQHTDNTELNVDIIARGQSRTFTITKKGTFGYHNHLNASDTGTIVVK